MVSVSCIMAMQVGFCLSPCALSLLRQRQQLSTAMGCFYPASGSQKDLHELSQIPGPCRDPNVFLQE